MSILNNFPFMNQLAQPNYDGLADIDKGEECLAVDIACIIKYFAGKNVSGEELVHAVFGAGWLGGTWALKYVDYVNKKYGVALRPVNGSPAYLVSQVHALLAQGKPVIATIPSTYAPPPDVYNPGSSHCIVFYRDEPGTLHAMNPWYAFEQSGSDQWWMQRFCFNQIWYGEKSIMSGVPSGWKDSGEVLMAPNGVRVIDGFRAYVLANAWHPENYPIEEAHDYGAAGTEQIFRFAGLAWGAKTGVQEIPLGEALVSQLSRVTSLSTQVAQLQSDLAKAPKSLPVLDASTTDLLKTFANLYLALQVSEKV